MAVRQLKGLNHCKLIKRRAKRRWAEMDCSPGLWDQCLRTEIENHRLEVEASAVAKRVEMQLAFSSQMFCDEHGWQG